MEKYALSNERIFLKPIKKCVKNQLINIQNIWLTHKEPSPFRKNKSVNKGKYLTNNGSITLYQARIESMTIN